MIINFIYYLIFGSAVLFYGIGLHKAITKSRKPKNMLMELCKFSLTISVTSVLVYLLNTQLIKIGFGELGPFLAILLISIINLFLRLVFKISPRTFIFDIAIELLCVIVGLTESVSLLECLFSSLSCMLSYFICVPLFSGLRKRIEINSPTTNIRNLALLFVSLAVMVLVLMSWNITWLNKGRV